MTMTKEEAIQIIKTRFYPSHVGLITNETRENAKALRMAVEALSADVVSREVYEKRIQADERIIDSYRREFAEAASAEVISEDIQIKTELANIKNRLENVEKRIQGLILYGGVIR